MINGEDYFPENEKPFVLDNFKDLCSRVIHCNCFRTEIVQHSVEYPSEVLHTADSSGTCSIRELAQRVLTCWIISLSGINRLLMICSMADEGVLVRDSLMVKT